MPEKEDKKKDIQPVPVTFHCATNGTNATSMVVPVWISSASSPTQEALTYAMLDTQSDSSFLLRTTAEALGIHGQPVKLKLATMTANSTVSNCDLIRDINMRGLHSEQTINISKLYTREFIPAERSLIPMPETALKWPHLEPIAGELPASDARLRDWNADRVQLSAGPHA